MGKKRKNAAKGEGTSLEHEVRGLCEAMLADPAIARFELAIDKGLGLARLRVTAHDGRVSTRELIGPALAAASSLNGPSSPRENRNAMIRELRAKGLTQVGIARVLGVSQALVSKVLRPLPQEGA